MSKNNLDVFKAQFYFANARPDSDVRIFNDEKFIHLQNIIELNHLIHEKLGTLNTVGCISDISVSLSDKHVLSFSDWSAFQNYNWNISAHVKEMRLIWDISIILPEYEIPQRHKVNVRLGSTLKPDEIIDLMYKSGPDFELEETTANLVCKIDFINPMISGEIMNIVAAWHGALDSTEVNKAKWVKFIEKHPLELGRALQFSVELLAVLVIFDAVRIWYRYYGNGFSSQLKTNDFFTWLAVASGLFLSMSAIAQMLGYHSHSLVHKLNGYSHFFALTSGDRQYRRELANKDNATLKKIVVRAAISIGSAVLVAALNIIWAVVGF